MSQIVEVSKKLARLALAFFMTTMFVICTGCSSSDNAANAGVPDGGAPKSDALWSTGSEITLTGNLLAPVKADSTGTPLAGYALFCVTLADPPVAGTGTADAQGAVLVKLAAANVPFGCFVRDTVSKVVATLVFAKSQTETSETLMVHGSTYFGSILVDETNGVASASVAGSNLDVVSDSPAGLPCPLGIWTTTLNQASCVSGLAMTERVTIKKDPNNDKLLISSVYGPMYLGAGDTNCGYGSLNNAEAAYANNGFVLGQDIPIEDGSCTTKTGTYQGALDQDCKKMTVTGTIHGCLDCTGSGGDGGGQCNGCGQASCAAETLVYDRQEQ